MRIIRFLESCNLLVEEECPFSNDVRQTEHTFFVGDEEEVLEINEHNEGSFIYFMDGKFATVPTEYFVVIDGNDETDLW